jgi:hypothetical protein
MSENKINPQVEDSVIEEFLSQYLPSGMKLSREQLRFIIKHMPVNSLVTARNDSLRLQEAIRQGVEERARAQERSQKILKQAEQWQRKTGKSRVANVFGRIDEEIRQDEIKYRERNEKLFMVLLGIIPGLSEEDTQPINLGEKK